MIEGFDVIQRLVREKLSDPPDLERVFNRVSQTFGNENAKYTEQFW